MDAPHPTPPAGGETAPRATPAPSEAEQALVRAACRLPEADRRALAEWGDALLAIRAADGSALRKAILALRLEETGRVLAPMVRVTGRLVYDLAWRDRTWAARLGIGAAGLTAAAVGGQGAGIAALGGAVGVPLWVVLGAGGTFAGTLVDELRRSLQRGEPERGARGLDGPVVDAEYRIVPGSDDMPLVEVLSEGDEPAPPREPLWRVFRRAYREARARQRALGGEEVG